MGRVLAGSIATLLLLAGGLVWWSGRDSPVGSALIAQPSPAPQGPDLPGEGDPDAVGTSPPMPPEADSRTREQKRFDRYDRNRDGAILRSEMMASRTGAFRKLDKDGNNLLSFEEWAVATSDRFAGADANRDGKLTRPEFATTARESAAKLKTPQCACEDEE